jgi:hypothetical protein
VHPKSHPTNSWYTFTLTAVLLSSTHFIFCRLFSFLFSFLFFSSLSFLPSLFLLFLSQFILSFSIYFFLFICFFLSRRVNNKKLLRQVRPSVCLYVTNRQSLNRFSLNLLLESFTKIYSHNFGSIRLIIQSVPKKMYTEG